MVFCVKVNENFCPQPIFASYKHIYKYKYLQDIQYEIYILIVYY